MVSERALMVSERAFWLYGLCRPCCRRGRGIVRRVWRRSNTGRVCSRKNVPSEAKASLR